MIAEPRMDAKHKKEISLFQKLSGDKAACYPMGTGCASDRAWE